MTETKGTLLARLDAGAVRDPAAAEESRWFRALHEKIDLQTARVGIVGLGYVGLPLARAFAERGFPVLGFDIDSAKVRRLRRGESYIGHIPPETIGTLLDQGFEPTDRFARQPLEPPCHGLAGQGGAR